MTAGLISFSVGSDANSAPPAAVFHQSEIFPRKRVPVKTMGFSAVNRTQPHPSKDIFLKGDNFKMCGVNAASSSAKMINLHSFWNRFSNHQASGSVQFTFDFNTGISFRGDVSGPEPAPAVWLHFVFFLKHLLCISTFL